MRAIGAVHPNRSPREVHCRPGQNGGGKSAPVRSISGMERPDTVAAMVGLISGLEMLNGTAGLAPFTPRALQYSQPL